MEESKDGRDQSQQSDDDGVVGIVRSMSQRTLALVAPPVKEILATLVGIWAQMLLTLLASGSATATTADAVSSDSVDSEYVDAEPELKCSVDNQVARKQSQACC